MTQPVLEVIYALHYQGTILQNYGEEDEDVFDAYPCLLCYGA